MIPALGKAPLRSPVLIQNGGKEIMLPPLMAEGWQRWFVPVFNALSALIGGFTDPAFRFNGIAYRWMSVLRLAVPQSAIAAIQLGVEDTGLLIHVTDYNHVLQWQGKNWDWGPGEMGSGFYSPFAFLPNRPGWQLCDGTLGVKYLKSDGTLGMIDVPTVVADLLILNGADTYFRT